MVSSPNHPPNDRLGASEIAPGQTMTNDGKAAALNPAIDSPPAPSEIPEFVPQRVNASQGRAERFAALARNTHSKGSKGGGKSGGKGSVGKTISRGSNYTPTSTPKPKKRKVAKKKAFKISGVFLGGQKYGTLNASRKTVSGKSVARKRYRSK